MTELETTREGRERYFVGTIQKQENPYEGIMPEKKRNGEWRGSEIRRNDDKCLSLEGRYGPL